MKAIVYDEYGAPDDVLELREIDEPAVSDDEVLVRVCAASANPYDWHMLRGLPYPMRMMTGLRAPKGTTVLGSDMAGQVEAVGTGVTGFRPGDAVYAEVGSGGFAEYVSVSGDSLALKPANVSFDQAAAVPMAAESALQGLRDKGNVQTGQKVLINGASGGVGTFAVQIAKHLGAEVTGVCSAKNVDLVRSIGADHVVDYTEEDFTQGDQRYDLMAVLTSPFVRQKLVPVNDKPNQDLDFLSGLLEAGEIAPVIDRTYPLSGVPEAMRYLEEGHARGKVVIAVADDE